MLKDVSYLLGERIRHGSSLSRMIRVISHSECRNSGDGVYGSNMDWIFVHIYQALAVAIDIFGSG
jgi:hypothetical protein